jgi:hypothetical protein
MIGAEIMSRKSARLRIEPLNADKAADAGKPRLPAGGRSPLEEVSLIGDGETL